MTTTEKYNGWTNYETWAANLWLTNDQSSDSYWRENAAEVWENAEAGEVFTRSEDARCNLAERLKDEIESNVPEVEGMYLDLLNAAISEIDWSDLADGFLSDCDGYESSK